MTDPTAAKTKAPPAADAPDPRIEAAKRAQECGKAIEKVLAAHGCAIAAYLQPLEPVGNDGAKAMVTAAFGIFPNEPVA